jgi:predicted TIM-barrel fold metal-dependent hydrolase
VLWRQRSAHGVAAMEPTLAAPQHASAAMPEGFSIIDAHIHLWDLTQFPVPWIAGNPILDRSYVLQDYKDQSAGLGVGGIVYVQAAVANEYSLLEADYIADLAAVEPLV